MHSHFLAGLVLSLVALGCGVPPLPPGVDRPFEKRLEHSLTTCEVPGSGGVVQLTATREGLVLGFAASEEQGLELHRFAGLGCALQRDGSAPIAVETLLDADDLGNVYAFPRETKRAGSLSTMLPGEYPRSMVAKVDAAGRVSKLLAAGRGIWSFGVSPEGGSLWVTACGPNGIFSVSKVDESALAPPDSLWEQRPSVLTSDKTFWSVGFRTCAPGEPMTPGCGFALVRSTPEGSGNVGTTVVDFGKGFEEATLARCGNRVCGMFASAVLVWDDAGKVLQTLRPADFTMLEEETIGQVSGNQHGVYVLLHGKAGTRVVFVPVR